MDSGVQDVFKKINEQQYDAPQWVHDARNELDQKGWRVFDEPQSVDAKQFGAGSGDAWNLTGHPDMTVFAIQTRSAKGFLRQADRRSRLSLAFLPDGTFQVRVRERVGRGEFQEQIERFNVNELPEWRGSVSSTISVLKGMVA